MINVSNPLLLGIEDVHFRVAAFKELVRSFYFQVLLSAHACPSCGGKVRMAGTSRALCETCGLTFDPTEAFQHSPCCGAPVSLWRSHYACDECRALVPSRFLFDEHIPDAAYFRDAMRESRERARERRERVRLMLLGTRSDSLALTDLLDLAEVPGLIDALSDFLGGYKGDGLPETFVLDEFRMDRYREIIRTCLLGHAVRFDAIPAVAQDARRDRVRRFITLVFMEHEREVSLSQFGDTIVVGPYEANIEG